VVNRSRSPNQVGVLGLQRPGIDQLRVLVLDRREEPPHHHDLWRQRLTIRPVTSTACFSRQPARAFIQKIAAATFLPLVAIWRGELFPAEQARVVRTLVDRVVVGPEGADIRLRVEGLAGLVRDLTASMPEALRVAA